MAHWTQTPEGKAKMAQVQKKAWKTKHAKAAQVAKDGATAVKVHPIHKAMKVALQRSRWQVTVTGCTWKQVEDLSKVAAALKVEREG